MKHGAASRVVPLLAAEHAQHRACGVRCPPPTRRVAAHAAQPPLELVHVAHRERLHVQRERVVVPRAVPLRDQRRARGPLDRPPAPWTAWRSCRGPPVGHPAAGSRDSAAPTDRTARSAPTPRGPPGRRRARPPRHSSRRKCSEAGNPLRTRSRMSALGEEIRRASPYAPGATGGWGDHLKHGPRLRLREARRGASRARGEQGERDAAAPHLEAVPDAHEHVQRLGRLGERLRRVDAEALEVQAAADVGAIRRQRRELVAAHG